MPEFPLRYRGNWPFAPTGTHPRTRRVRTDLEVFRKVNEVNLIGHVQVLRLAAVWPSPPPRTGRERPAAASSFNTASVALRRVKIGQVASRSRVVWSAWRASARDSRHSESA